MAAILRKIERYLQLLEEGSREVWMHEVYQVTASGGGSTMVCRGIKMACAGECITMSPFHDYLLSVCIKVQDLVRGTVFADYCDVLLSASGVLNSWKWPSIPGLHTFNGKLLHSAQWDEDYDYAVRFH
jgi:hypothetical protein